MTWTTDGFYRETAEKVAYRKEEGCAVVEMECSALAAVARLSGENCSLLQIPWQIWTTTTVVTGVQKLLIRRSNSVLLLCTTCECSYCFYGTM